jgi:transposase
MKKTYQFRIYPTKNHEVIMNRTLSTCRRLYNDSLAERKKQAELNRLRKSFDVYPSVSRISSVASAIHGFKEEIDTIVLHILKAVLS